MQYAKVIQAVQKSKTNPCFLSKKYQVLSKLKQLSIKKALPERSSRSTPATLISVLTIKQFNHLQTFNHFIISETHIVFITSQLSKVHVDCNIHTHSHNEHIYKTLLP